MGLKLSLAPLCSIWKADVLPPWGLCFRSTPCLSPNSSGFQCPTRPSRQRTFYAAPWSALGGDNRISPAEADHLIKLWEEAVFSPLHSSGKGEWGLLIGQPQGFYPPIPPPVVNSGSDRGREHPSIIPPPVRPSHKYGLRSSPVPGTVLLQGGIMVDRTGFQTWFGQKKFAEVMLCQAPSLDLKTLCSFCSPCRSVSTSRTSLGKPGGGGE